MLGDYYDKPDFRVDDRWTPDIDERNFNSILNDYLADIRL
jgi:predicted component of type VI protein secretion system